MSASLSTVLRKMHEVFAIVRGYQHTGGQLVVNGGVML